MYYYTAFGLSISSEIEFPELKPVDDTQSFDLRIQIGITPKLLENASFVSSDFWITPTQCLQYIENVAYYLAENGDTITVNPMHGADLKSLRIYLLCSAMAAIVHQRGFIPLHASGIVTKGSVALIIGDSGTGKSTSVRALMQRGHRIFTDDVCVVRLENDQPEGIPSYPVIKLWQTSFQLLGLGSVNENDRLWKDVAKYGVSFHDDYVSKWLPLTKIFILVKSDEKAVAKMEKQNGVEAFMLLASNTYRGWYVEPMNLNALHFKVVSKLLEKCEVFKITRRSKGDSLLEVINLLEQTL